MTSRISTFLFILFFSTSISAQIVPEVQRSLITKRTATWCSNCGSWGWSLFEGILEETTETSVLFAAHYNGDLTSTVAQDITSNWNAASQPRFYINHVLQSPSPSDISGSVANIKNQVDAFFQDAPIANVGFIHSYANGNIEVQAKVKFFQNATGEFSVGFYLLENDVVNNQAGQGNNAIHKRILRKSFTADSFGETFPSNSLNAGDTFDYNFSVSANDPVTTNYDIVAVIWEKVSGTYQVVNVIDDEQQVVSSTRETLLGSVEMEINPNISQSNSIVYLELSEKLNEIEIAVYDLNGKKVSQIFNGNLESGKHQFPVFQGINPVAGNYFVSLSALGSSISKKLIINN